MDVTRALLLPDFGPPPDSLLRNLALYWDEIAWVRRSAIGTESNVVGVLRECGVVVDVEAPEIPVTEILEAWTGHDREARPGEEAFLAFETDEAGRRVIKRYLWLDPSQLGPPNTPPPDDPSQDDYAFGRLVADQYVAEVDVAIALCARHNLAPVAYSPEAHLASLVGLPAREVPTREAALLSAVLTTFEIAPDTPIEDVLAFRERHHASMGRFRASIGDLASRLRDDVTPGGAFAQARDVIRNRVEPALSELEDVLKESRIKFAWKAALGASAITLAPVSPTAAVQGSAKLVGQTLDYTFSKEKLARSHPYGYLHSVATRLGHAGHATLPMVMALGDPRETLRGFFTALQGLARELENARHR